MIPSWENHFGKTTVWSLMYFLNYSLLWYLAQSQILGITLYIAWQQKVNIHLRSSRWQVLFFMKHLLRWFTTGRSWFLNQFLIFLVVFFKKFRFLTFLLLLLLLLFPLKSLFLLLLRLFVLKFLTYNGLKFQDAAL